MGVILIIVFLVFLLFSWPLVPGAIKHSEQDKRREAYQKRIKEEHAKQERQRLEATQEEKEK